MFSYFLWLYKFIIRSELTTSFFPNVSDKGHVFTSNADVIWYDMTPTIKTELVFETVSLVEAIGVTVARGREGAEVEEEGEAAHWGIHAAAIWNNHTRQRKHRRSFPDMQNLPSRFLHRPDIACSSSIRPWPWRLVSGHSSMKSDFKRIIFTKTRL